MKKTSKKPVNMRVEHCLDTVGVAGSIPVEPTISRSSNKDHNRLKFLVNMTWSLLSVGWLANLIFSAS
jgi:hypothetical protein